MNTEITKRKVLVVDPNPIMLDNIWSTLDSWKEELGIECGDNPVGPRDAIENIDKLCQYDAIVMVLQMLNDNAFSDPDPGFEIGELLYRKIRQQDGCQKINIIICDCKDPAELAIDFQKEANVDFIRTPLVEKEWIRLFSLVSGREFKFQGFWWSGFCEREESEETEGSHDKTLPLQESTTIRPRLRTAIFIFLLFVVLPTFLCLMSYPGEIRETLKDRDSVRMTIGVFFFLFAIFAVFWGGFVIVGMNVHNSQGTKMKSR